MNYNYLEQKLFNSGLILPVHLEQFLFEQNRDAFLVNITSLISFLPSEEAEYVGLMLNPTDTLGEKHVYYQMLRSHSGKETLPKTLFT